MLYPYLIYFDSIDHHPLFRGLRGDPYIADLSPESPLLTGLDVRDQAGLQELLEKKMASKGANWGLAAYLEDRRSLLADCPQMVSEERFIHLGLDIIVDLGMPLHAPLTATVAESGYEEGEGNYGGFVLLRHADPSFETFYSFYGHLRRKSLPPPGKSVKAGEAFAEIGDFHENGNWFYHTHLQVLTAKAVARGYLSKGYCRREDMAEMDMLCPSPLPLFKRG